MDTGDAFAPYTSALESRKTMSFAEANEIQNDLFKQITRQVHQSGMAKECRNQVGVSAKCGEVQESSQKMRGESNIRSIYRNCGMWISLMIAMKGVVLIRNCASQDGISEILASH